MNPEDTQTYFAKMNQGYEGDWLYTISFTPEPHQPAFVGGFYLAIGHLARVTGTSVIQMWHISRFVAGIFLFLTSYWFVSKFTENRATKWTAYLLILFGSGLGWLILLTGRNEWLGWLPIDFKMPEAHPFFTALTFPHIAFNSGFALLTLWHIRQIVLNKSGKWWRHALIAGIFNLIIAINFPFYHLPDRWRDGGIWLGHGMGTTPNSMARSVTPPTRFSHSITVTALLCVHLI